MFELTAKQFEIWRSQFVTSKSDKMGLRYKPMALSEQGVSKFTPLNAMPTERGINGCAYLTGALQRVAKQTRCAG